MPPPRKIIYLPTTRAYDRWAPLYDHDLNPLQALDDRSLPPLLSTFASLLPAPSADRPTTIVDLGCGTGRNTLKLLSRPATRVVGLDASSGMLEIARRRFGERTADLTPEEAAVAEFRVFDMIDGSPVPEGVKGVQGVVCTLVLEHVPVERFFATVAGMVVPAGCVLVSNMHEEMGARSQAGFVDPKTGEKIRPQSYVHSVEEVVAEAVRWGFRVVGEVTERGIEREDVEVLGPRAEKWVGMMCWFGMILEKVA
ncbi:hypothetical protein MMC13_004484 [Lambiella insularis]|nr:hypothetical protein [Lambiella insularis]